ncbi:MAG: aldo/keto reductase [Verrucomicrobia bacterium]|nr:aldo/keto reductase [Verrucomicrobiota bacterium]
MKTTLAQPIGAPRSAASWTRRDFLQRTALGSAGLALSAAARHARAADDSPLPRRVLGRTQARVSILGLGTAPIGEARVEVPKAVRIFSEIIDRGVNYVDTARIYGIAEEALGQVLATRRERVFLATKVWVETAVDAEKSLTESLRQLRVDHVDLVHIHHIGDKNLEKVLAPDGVLAYLVKQKEAGKLRFIGVSGHARPPRFLKLLETDQIDVVMPVMNYADRNIYNFEGQVLPECRKRNVGVVAMKVYAGIKGGFRTTAKRPSGAIRRPSACRKPSPTRSIWKASASPTSARSPSRKLCTTSNSPASTVRSPPRNAPISWRTASNWPPPSVPVTARWRESRDLDSYGLKSGRAAKAWR